MFMNKFYDAAVADAGGGETIVEAPVMSIAEAMAKHGSKSDENSVAEPIDIKEKKEVEKPVEENAAAKVVETPITEKPTSETSQENKIPAEEPKKETTPPIAETPAKVQTLEEVLKNNQPDTVLKALGFDDEKVALVQDLKEVDPKLVGIIQAWKSGQLEDYVKELATDYSKMEPEDVMRHQLRVDYPKATPRQLEILYKDEVIKKFNLDSDDEDEIAEGKELLAAKADKFRDSFIANQDKYLMPKPPEPKAAIVPDNTAELKAKEDVEAFKNEISNSPFAKDIAANKKITLGEGEGKFTFPIENPDELVATLTDANEWVKAMYDKVEVGADGKEYNALNTEKQLLVAAVQKFGMKFLDAYALHFKGLGGKEVTDKIDNAKPPEKNTSSKADPLPTSAAVAMAKSGTRVG